MTEKFSIGITYTNNLVLCSEPVEKVMRKYEEWKEALKGQVLRINICKTYIKRERDH